MLVNQCDQGRAGGKQASYILGRSRWEGGGLSGGILKNQEASHRSSVEWAVQIECKSCAKTWIHKKTKRELKVPALGLEGVWAIVPTVHTEGCLSP